jgi:uncharacterized protein (TIGR02611 family)
MGRDETPQGASRPPSDERGFWHRNARRVAVAVAGFLLILVGILLALPGVPGPGIVIAIGGLAVLATEFEWAERRLEWAKDRFEGAARRAGMDPKKAAIGGILLFSLLGIAGTVLWLALR